MGLMNNEIIVLNFVVIQSLKNIKYLLKQNKANWEIRPFHLLQIIVLIDYFVMITAFFGQLEAIKDLLDRIVAPRVRLRNTFNRINLLKRKDHPYKNGLSFQL